MCWVRTNSKKVHLKEPNNYLKVSINRVNRLFDCNHHALSSILESSCQLSRMVSMVLKLLLISLTIIQTNGCFDRVLKDVKDDFDTLDRDKNGFVTENEACYLVQSNSDYNFGADSGKICEKVWKNMDLNKDGKATCQEVLVGAMALHETMNGEFGHQLRTIFTDKSENCQEITNNEMHSLIMVDINETNEINVQDVYRRVDANRDGVFSCKGTFEL